MPGRIQVDLITPSVNKIKGKLKNLPKDAYNFWVKTTPIKTGNARSRTKLNGTTIDANYQYAKPLDRGHSKQAPKGMTQPTKDYIAKRVKQSIRK